MHFSATGRNNRDESFSRFASRRFFVWHRDRDRDGLPVDWGRQHDLNPKINDAKSDPGKDGAVNLVEYRYGTDPHDLGTDGGGVADGTEIVLQLDPHFPRDDRLAKPDRDRDGLPDRWEIIYGTYVAKADAGRDPDRDLLSNKGEFKAGTAPHQRDSDGDGILDGKELARGTDPLDPKDY